CGRSSRTNVKPAPVWLKLSRSAWTSGGLACGRCRLSKIGTDHRSRDCRSASNSDLTRSAASETALRRILLPPKMMNCREGLTLRSSGAAGRALQIRIKPKTPAALPNLDTTDRCYRLARLITSTDKALYPIRWTKDFV